MKYLQYMTEDGLTDREIARLLGISTETLRNWKAKRQRSRPTKATLRLMEVLLCLYVQAPMLHDALVKITKSDCSSKSTKTH